MATIGPRVMSPEQIDTYEYFKQFKQKMLKVKLLSTLGKLPVRGSPGSAGYDLFSAETIKIEANEFAKVKTDIAVAIPEGYYGRIAPRSSLAAKHIDVGAGVVDQDYRGEIKIIMYNFGKTDFTINVGDRIAQLIITKIITPEVMEVKELDETSRGEGGFGSTGTN